MELELGLGRVKLRIGFLAWLFSCRMREKREESISGSGGIRKEWWKMLEILGKR